jgi:hypothetical protein
MGARANRMVSLVGGGVFKKYFLHCIVPIQRILFVHPTGVVNRIHYVVFKNRTLFSSESAKS